MAEKRSRRITRSRAPAKSRVKRTRPKSLQASTPRATRPQKVRIIGSPMRVVQTKPAMVIEWPRTLIHHHTYGLLTPFFQGLLKGELRATRCVNPLCQEKRFWLPPRADCPDCHARMEWIRLRNPVIGEVFTFTRIVNPGQGIELSHPYYQIDVKIEGAATIMKGYLVRGEPSIGMKVRAGFRTKNPTHTILDLYWEPVE